MMINLTQCSSKALKNSMWQYTPCFPFNGLFLLNLFPAVCNEDYPCEGMSRHATFENFGMAFLTLFQVSTGDNWNGIMKVKKLDLKDIQ